MNITLPDPDIETVVMWRTGTPSAMRIYHHDPHGRKYGATHDAVIVTAGNRWQAVSNRKRILSAYRLMRTNGVNAYSARQVIYDMLFASTIAEGVLYENTDGEQS